MKGIPRGVEPEPMESDRYAKAAFYKRYNPRNETQILIKHDLVPPPPQPDDVDAGNTV